MKSFALTAFALTFGAVSVLAFPLAARDAEEAKFPEISEEHIEHLEDLTGDKTPSHYEISIRKGDDKVLICSDGKCGEVDLDEACKGAPVDDNGECVYLHNHIDLQYGDSSEDGEGADQAPEVTPEQLESLKAFSTVQPTHYEISIKGPDDTVFICKDGDCKEHTMEEACADAQTDENGVCVWENNHISLEYGDDPVDAPADGEEEPAEGEDEEPAEGDEEEPADGEEEQPADGEEEQPADGEEEESADGEEEQPADGEEESAEEEQPEEESAEEEQPEEEQPEEESAEVEGEPEEGAEEEQPAEEENADDKEAEEEQPAEEDADKEAEEEQPAEEDADKEAEEEQPAEEEDADKEVEEGAEEPEEEAQA